VVLQQPKISPYIKRMRDNIAEALKLQPGQVSVKATTNDEIGSIGLGEGAAAYAVTSLENS
jgi:2-C-methyl-D-erythritol 2,4-cyclodiphosphate synthase